MVRARSGVGTGSHPAPDALCRAADEKMRQVQHIENTDSVLEDVRDFVTGTDYVP